MGVRQHTQDVLGCPSVHISEPCTHRTLVGVCQHKQDVRGCPWLFVSTHRMSVAVRVCPCLPVSTHRMSVGVRQHTQDVRLCLSAHTGHPWLSVCFRMCPSAHTGRLWLSISTHISTLVLGLSTLTLPVDCSGDFGPRGLSVQYTQDVSGMLVLELSMLALPVDCSGDFGPRGLYVQYTQDIRGCPSAHTGHPWLSVCVCVCPSAHTGRPWLSISTYIRTLVLGLSTLTLPVDCSGDFGPRGLSVQYTQDVLHTGRLCVSVSTQRTSVAVRVCPSAHTKRPWLSISTHISTLVLGLRTLALPVYCLGDFGPRGLSVQYKQDVRGCPPAHTGRPTHRMSVDVRQHKQDIRVCPSAHTRSLWLSMCVRKHTHDGRVCPSAHTGRPWLSISTHISTLVLGLSTLTLPVDGSGDFGPRWLSVQYTQDVRGCPPAHTGRPWLSVSTHRMSVAVCGGPCVSVCVRQHTQDVRDCPAVHISARWTSVCVRQHTRDVRGCPCVSVSTHKTSVAVHQYTYQHVGHWTQHAGPSRGLFGDFGPRGLSVKYTQDVHGCPPAHTGRPWLSISTHIRTLVLGLSMLTLPVDCLGDFLPTWAVCSVHTGRWWVSASTNRTSVAVRGCLSAHIGCPWLSVCVRVCPTSVAIRAFPCVSFSTHRTSVAVHQYTYQHVVHTGRQWVSARTHMTSVCVRVCPSVSVSTHRTSVAIHPYTYQHVGPWTQHAGPSRGLFGTSVAVRVCPCVSVSTHRTSVAVHQYIYQNVGPWTQHADPSSGLLGTLVLGLSTLALPVDCLGDFGPRGLSVQYTQDVCVCPSAHKGRPWLSVCVRQHKQNVRGCPSVHISARCTNRMSVGVRQHTQDIRGCPTHRMSVGVRQHKQDIRVCPSAHTRSLWLSVCVRQHTHDGRVCLSAHTGRPWLSISTHISTFVLGLSTLPFPWMVRVILAHVGCLFSTHRTSVGVRQHTQDVRGCPSAHTGFPWLSVGVRVCPCVSVSTHRTSVTVQQYTYQHAGPWTQHAGPSGGLFRTSVCVRQHTRDVRGCPCVSVSTHKMSVAVHQYTYQHVGHWTQHADPSRGLFGDFGPRGLSVKYTQDVHGCPPAHTGRPWLSISTHIRTLVLGLSMLTLPVDCLGDFLPTWAVCSVHTGRWWVSASTNRTTVAVRGCLSAHIGCPWLSVCVRVCPTSVAIRAFPCVSFSTHRMSVAVHQYTYQHVVHTGRQWVSARTHMTSVCVRVCPSVSVSTHRTSVAVHPYTYQHVGPWTQHAGPSRGLFGTSVAVRVCPSAHTGRPWLSISTYIRTLVLGLSTLTLPVDCSGDFGPRGLSVQYTQDVRGLHTGHLCVSVSTQRTSVAVRVCPSAHTKRPWLSISTHISTLVLGLRTLALPVYCLGDFGPRGLSVQYKQDVRGCPPAHTGHPWLSVSTHMTSVAIRVCPCVYVCARQDTQDVRGCPTHMMAVCVRQHTQDVRGCPSVHISARCTHRTSVGVRQHTQDVRGCPSAHTGCPWLSVGVRVCPCVSVSTHRTSVTVQQYTYQHAGPWTQHAGPSGGLFRTSVCVRQHTRDVRGCPCVSVSTHKTFVAVHQYTYQHVGHWTQHADPSRGLFGDFGPRGLSVKYTQDVHGCPPAHTGRPWLSISTHIRTLVLGLSTLALPVDCLGDFLPTWAVCSVHTGRWWVSASTNRTSVAVRGCLSAHIGCLWLSVCVRVCPTSVAIRVFPCVSFSTHRTSVALHQYTYQHVVHTGRQWVSARTHMTSVCVRVCHLCPSAHTGHPLLSIRTHISMLVLGLSMLALPVDCSGDFGPRGLYVQYTQDIRGCPSAHTGHPWLSVCVRVCPSAHTGRPWLFISTFIRTLVLGLSTLTLPVDCSGDFGPRGLSVQYTQDVRGCPPAHTGRPWLSVSTHRMSVAVCGGPCVPVCVRQHTQDVRDCPAVHISACWTSVCVRQHTRDVRGCPCVSVSTHKTSVAVHQYTYQHVGHWTQHADPSRGLFGDFGPRGLSVKYTQDVHGCPPAHTGRPWLSISTHIRTLYTQDVGGCLPAQTGRPWLFVSTHRMSVAVRVCPCLPVSTHRMSVGVRQHTQDVRLCLSAHTGHPWLSVRFRVCPSAHTGRLWLSIIHTGRQWVSARTHMTSVCVRVCPSVSVSTHRTSVAVHPYTYQHVGPWTQHAGPSRGLFGTSVAVRVCPCVSVSTHRTSVAVHQYIYPNVGPWTQHADPSSGLLGTSVAVRVCPSAHTGRPWLSVCVRQHTQDVHGCLCVSVSTHRTSVAVCVSPSPHTGCSCVSVRTHMTSVAVHQYTYQDVGPWTKHADPSRGLFG
ncbi:hypothetical protein YC2023_108626 [Brassica napus]